MHRLAGLELGIEVAVGCGGQVTQGGVDDDVAGLGRQARVRRLVGRGVGVLLVKPQFEVGRGRLNGQGVVTDPRDRTRALEQVVAAVGEHGLYVHGIRTSPISGTSGTTEYLLWARSVPSDTMSGDRVRDAVRATTTHPTSGG